MKIAFINAYQGNIERGAETYVAELTLRLKNRHTVDIISDNSTPKDRWPILWRICLDPRGLNIFWFTFKNLGKIFREKYDIVIPINGGWQPFLIRLATWVYGGKMVISGQSGKGWDDRINLWSFPDMFIALSSALKKWSGNVNPFVRSTYVPNGVDTQKFIPVGEKIDFGLKKPLILSVGALDNDKRMDLVIKAVSKIKKGSLILVGKGKMEEKLRQLGKKLLGDRFKIMSFNFKDMPKVYRSVDLFTLASPSYRSFEIVITEAMASGLPVVVNNDPIRSEIVGNSGILVDPENEIQYSEALAEALKTDWKNRPVSEASRFSWNKISNDYGNLFKSLMLD